MESEGIKSRTEFNLKSRMTRKGFLCRDPTKIQTSMIWIYMTRTVIAIAVGVTARLRYVGAGGDNGGTLATSWNRSFLHIKICQ
jgi:hypothetical protein